MKILNLILFIYGLTVAIPGFSQSNIQVDSFYYYVRNIQTADELTPLSENDPDYKEPEAELTLVILFKDPSQIGTVTIDLGSQKDLGDIKHRTYGVVQNDNGTFLKNGDKLFPVNNKRVIITENVPASIYWKKIHLSVKPANRSNMPGEKKNQVLN